MIFFLNKLSLSLHNFRNFPGHSTGKQRTDETRHARSARTRKDALTSAVSKVPPFSKKNGKEKFGEKCPIYKTEFRIDVPGEYFFSGLGQCTKAGAMEPPSHLCVRERTRLLVLFPRFDFSNKKNGGNVQKNARSTKPNSTSTFRANILFLGSANAPRQTRERNGQTS